MSNPAFISYARSDAAMAISLVCRLRDIGANVWLDQLDIQKGEHWDDAVQQAIRNASALVVLLSRDAVASSNVKDEIAEALDSNVRVIPVIIAKCQVPLRLKRVQYIDATIDPEAAADEIAAALEARQPPQLLGKQTAPQKEVVAHTYKWRLRKPSLLVTSAATITAAIGATYFTPIHTYNDHGEIPSLDESTDAFIVTNSDQLTHQGGKLLQQETKITSNGYFTFVIPKFDGFPSSADAKDQGGVKLAREIQPNLFITAQLRPSQGVNTIDLWGCNIALVTKIRSRSLFFYSTESDASAANIPIEIDFNRYNTIALRQVGKHVTAFINGEARASYKFNTMPASCRPQLFFKANTDQQMEIHFQGLAVYEFGAKNIFGLPVPRMIRETLNKVNYSRS